MKKITTFCFFALLLCYSAINAQTLDVGTAQQVAKNFFYEINPTVSSANDVEIIESYVETFNTDTVYYVFNLFPTGFVMVSATEKAKPILGYSKHNQFDWNNQPSTLLSFTNRYKVEIQYLKQHNNIPIPHDLAARWSVLKTNNLQLSAEREPVQSVGPLTTTTWNQPFPYNTNCPTNTNGQQTVTGCVATAMAQIIRYYQYPSSCNDIAGYLDAVNTDGYEGVLSSIATHNYNYSNMPNSISSNNTEIANLMRDAGYSVQMNYGINASGAWVYRPNQPTDARRAFESTFKYNTVTANLRSTFSDSQWESLLINELNAGRVVLFSGYHDNAGHAWVCDGYTEYTLDTWFQMNWGWGGTNNGEYTISSSSILSQIEDWYGYENSYLQNELILTNIQPRTLPPVFLVASDGPSNAITITWANGGNTSWTNATYYQLQRSTNSDFSTYTTLGGWQTAISYIDYSATPNTLYYYRVVGAKDNVGTNPSDPSVVNTGIKTSLPTNVSATDGTYTDRVRITWTGATGQYYQVYRNTTNSTIGLTTLNSTWQTATTYDDLTAVAGTTYYYFVRAATNNIGSNPSSYSTSNSGYKAMPATIPTSVSATDGTYTDRVRITWTGATGQYYQVYRNTTNSTIGLTTLNSTWQTATTYDDLTAVAGTTYYYFVRAATNNIGSNPSSYSTSNSGYKAMPATIPTSVSATDGTYTDRVRITWTGATGQYYQVYRNTTNSTIGLTTLNSTWQTATTYDDLTAVAGTTYYYFVRAATNNIGSNPSSYSTSNSGYKAMPATIPTSVSATDGTYTDRVRITWTGATGQYYQVYRNTTNSTIGLTTLNSTWQTATTYDDLTAVAGTTYYYFVRAATNNIGSNPSSYSTSNSGYKAMPATIPTNVSATDGTYTDRVRITWTGATGQYYQVYRNTTNSTIGLTTLNSTWQTATTYDDLTAVAGTTYYYFVRAATNNIGSNPSSYSTSNSGYRTSLLTTSISTISFSAAASSSSFTITSNVSWTISDNATWLTVSPASGSNNNTIVASCTANTTTATRTATITIVGGGITRTINITQAGSTTTCGTPTGLAMNSVTQSSIAYSWNAVSGVAGYNLQISTNNINFNDLIGANGSSLISYYSIHTTWNCLPNTTYYIRVRSVCANNITSSWSNSLVTTTLAGPVNDDPCGSFTLTPSTSWNYTFASNVVSGLTNYTASNLSCSIAGCTDVWFKFVATSNTHTIQTNLQSFGTLDDPIIAVYGGNSCSNTATWVGIECDDDDGDGYMARINRTDFVVGNTYWIRLWGVSGEAGTIGIGVLTGTGKTESLSSDNNNNDAFNINNSLSDTNNLNTEELQIEAIKSIKYTSLSLALAPNPTQSQTTLRYYTNQVGSSQIKVCDLTGKVVINQAITHNTIGEQQYQLDTSTLPKGVYIVQLQTDHSNPQTAKLIIH